MHRVCGSILILLLFATVVPDAAALHWDRVVGLCLDLELPREVWREDIPVGWCARERI